MAPLLAGLQTRAVFQQAEARPFERLGRLRTHPRSQRFLPTRGQVHRHQGCPFAAGRSQPVEMRRQLAYQLRKAKQEIA